MINLPTVLIVDDELSIRESFNLILSDKYNILTAASGEAAVKYAADNAIDLTFLDIRMPGMDGLETLKKLREINPELMIIMVTAVNDVQKASEAIRLGALDYVVKPFDVDDIMKIAANLMLKKSILAESRKVFGKPGESGIIGASEKILTVKKCISESAGKSGGVLIFGPEGVEKKEAATSIAQCVIFNAKNPHKPLFGKNGGSTVAELKRVPGAIDDAVNGAIFIDNAEFLPKWAQEKLLEHNNVRIFLGTTANLKEIDFNKALYDRAAETIIEMPALVERASDIPLILEYYLDKANAKYYRNVKRFSPEALNMLTSYPWPGNIEELSAVIFNIILLLDDKQAVEADDLPYNILANQASFHPINMEELYSDIEKIHIKEVLKSVGQDKENAAKILGISLNVLGNKV